jgi:hypothetical protein
MCQMELTTGFNYQGQSLRKMLVADVPHVTVHPTIINHKKC